MEAENFISLFLRHMKDSDYFSYNRMVGKGLDVYMLSIWRSIFNGEKLSMDFSKVDSDDLVIYLGFYEYIRKSDVWKSHKRNRLIDVVLEYKDGI